MTEAERCLAEIARCEEHLRGGGPDEAGAFLGLMDWRNELHMVRTKQDPYAEFIAAKQRRHVPVGFELFNPSQYLYPFQRYIVDWAVKLGRAAIFADCGLGKTLMQLEWARAITEHTGRPVLILAPLAVSSQTKREGERFSIPVRIVRGPSEVGSGINITNYEMLHHFDASAFAGVVLDESSILKSYSGTIRNRIINAFAGTPYRLACTATPSPNDYMELGNHSEFLGVMTRTGMLATYFNHDGGETSKWKIKGHAQKPFMRWMSSWCVMIAKPSDIGFDDAGYDLKPIRRHFHTVRTEAQEGVLFPVEAVELSERRESRKVSIDDRIRLIADMVNKDKKTQWVIWGDLNAETDAATNAILDAVQVAGNDDPVDKEDRMLGFADGRYRVLVTKPKIGGWGMNWQNCHKMAFLGLSDSYEATYQAERRCWRYGQQHPVDVHIVITDRDGAVVRNINRKREQAEQLTLAMVEAMKETHG